MARRKSSEKLPKSVEELFHHYRGRRAGIIRALTTDVEDFFQQCDPAKENLSLYGLPNGEWKVDLPVDEVPSEVPEPSLGINFARNGMSKSNWLNMVAAHSDAWLLALTFFYGYLNGFGKADRHHLFGLINDLKTVEEVVREKYEERASFSNKSNKTYTIYKQLSRVAGLHQTSRAQGSKSSKAKMQAKEEEIDVEGCSAEEEEEEHGDTFCGTCGKKYRGGQFWIGCDVCEKWYHGRCVNITPARADLIKQYSCPYCSARSKKS